MKYIKKTDTPQFFLDDTENFSEWSDYNQNEETKQQRRNLRDHILRNEQNHLCGYCESKVHIDNTHTDHKKPKDRDKYPELVFSYENLIISCQGNIHATLEKGIEEYETTCGHHKDNHFNETLFLDPHLVSNISDFFSYDKDNGKIHPRETDENTEQYKKAQFMIFLLRLNEGSLPRARTNARKALLQRMRKINTGKKDIDAFLKGILTKNNNAFISFLVYCFAKRLIK